VASQMAVQTIGAEVAGATLEAGSTRGLQPRTTQLGHAVEVANRAIYERALSDSEHAGMGTTVVGAWVADNVVSIAHVGDSRAYVSSHEGFEAVTVDHSLIEAQVRSGSLSREASLTAAHQNVLLRALGKEPDVEVELNEITVAAGDRVLLCTDGLTRMVSDGDLADTLSRFRGDPQGACDSLIAAANHAGGPDNITAVVIEIEGSTFGRILDLFKP